MCANGILREVTHFNLETGVRDGFDYEFTYQKFSDHLIVRFYLQSVRKDLESKRAYSEINLIKAVKRGHLLKSALNEWNYGLIEALRPMVENYVLSFLKNI